MIRLPFGWRLEKGEGSSERLSRPYPRAIRRSFDAAKSSNLLADWGTYPNTSDEALRNSLRSLRARARQQVDNNPYVRRFASAVTSNVVGPRGIVLQARIKDQGKLSAAANDAIEETWESWGRSRYCDVAGKQTWRDIQRLFLRTVAVDGEAILRMYRGKRFGPHRFAVQFIDPELLDVDKNEILADGRVIRMGVEYDFYRRPVAYWFIDSAPTLDGGLQMHTGKHVRVSADEIIHAFVIERVNQTRGLPWLVASLFRLKMLGAYEDAALVAARVGASKMGFIYSEDGANFTGDDEDEAGSVIEDVEPGVFRQLPAGMRVESFSPEYPRGEYSEFQKAMLRGISAGMLVSYSTLSQDLEGVNYSSIRAGLLEERDQWRVLQEWLADVLCAPVFHTWLEMQMLQKSIAVDGAPLNVEDIAQFERVVWRGRRWDWVDPLKEMQAAALGVEARLLTRSSVIRDRTQDDPSDVIAEMAQEDALLDSYGLLDKGEDLSIPPPLEETEG